MLPPEVTRRRGSSLATAREALCCLRMSPVQLLFLLGLAACLAFFSLDAWTDRRVLRLCYLTLVRVLHWCLVQMQWAGID